MNQNRLFIRESILELDAPTVPVDAGARSIGYGTWTIKVCEVPFLDGRFSLARPATPPFEVARPPPPASAAEPQARVAVIKNAISRNPIGKPV